MVPSDDSFISEEEEEFCPLCVEEMDISDKNFKPCPCGYQICQFCYNNIRQNPELNGRCPGCRRFYDDESVEYKSISADEYRSQQLKREKRDKEKKQREKEKKETEMANKKHLAGLRVVQKNLVYVTGLNPPCSPDDLHSALRSDKYFGQYGKILKIVINKKTPNPASTHHHHSNPGLVVYVTFTRKEDALKCINELDGSLCDGRILRAAHGTTKYCSSYLRGHPCPNPNCMFLHEPGEEADSYTRKDLSTQQGIKMGMIGLSGQRNTSGSHHEYNSDDEIMPSDDDDGDYVTTHVSSTHHTTNNGFGGNNNNNVTSTNNNNNSTSTVSTPLATPSTLHSNNGGPVLPATAHWAKGTNTSASASPSVNNNVPLANAAAFPTLGEIFKEQKQQVRKDSKQKIKSNKSSKDTNILLPDDIDIDDNSAIQFTEETAEHLKKLSENKDKLKVYFSSLSENSNDENENSLPLFVFEPNANYSNNTKLEEEKLIAHQIIERFILRPIKNYHLSYQNHPITQQQSLLQQQQQQQQVQQQQVTQAQQLVQQQQAKASGTPHLNSANLQLDQQQKELSEQHQHSLSNGGDNNVALQQQQQLLLLQQLQQQQLQHHQQQAQTPSQAQAQINNLRMNERSANTSTPPPPGLLAGAGKSIAPPGVPSNNLVNQQYPHHYPQSTNVANPSSSSQLLTQLMNGKR